MRELHQSSRHHLPYLETHVDRDIAREIGAHQVLGAPLTLKHLLLLGIASDATVQRRLRRLKQKGVVRETRSGADRRVVELSLSPAAMKGFAAYGQALDRSIAPSAAPARRLRAGRHSCAMAHGSAESAELIARFLAVGLRQRQACLLVAPLEVQRGIRGHLRIMAPGAEGRLEVRAGFPDPVAALEFMREFMERASRQRRRGRVAGEMRWALDSKFSFDALLEYERKLETLSRRYAASVLCAYDVCLYSGKEMLAVLKEHRDTRAFPVAIV
jgi:DNA-binding MarR family transcriptional regulator